MPGAFRTRPTELAQALRNQATDAERLLWRHLRQRQLGGFKFSRQMPVGPYVVDFLCREARLIIEVDGGQHAIEAERDAQRTERLHQQGYQVIRFWNNDVMANIEGVLQDIGAALRGSPTPQPPPASGRGSEACPEPTP